MKPETQCQEAVVMGGRSHCGNVPVRTSVRMSWMRRIVGRRRRRSPPPPKNKNSPYGLGGGFDKIAVCGKWCAIFLDPRAPDLVAQNSQISNFMIVDILGKSLYHEMVLGPPNWSLDFIQQLGVAGPVAFGGNTF